MKQNFKPISTKSKFRCKLFEVQQKTVEFRKKERDYYIVDHPGAVVILPLLGSDTLILVKQYRIAADHDLLEFPAGVLEAGEDTLVCAKRELAEEVSYQAENWQAIGKIFPAPGFCSELLHLFFAKDLTPYSLPADEDEVLETVELTIPEFEDMIQAGELQDAKTLAAFTLARSKGLL